MRGRFLFEEKGSKKRVGKIFLKPCCKSDFGELIGGLSLLLIERYGMVIFHGMWFA